MSWLDPIPIEGQVAIGAVGMWVLMALVAFYSLATAPVIKD